MCDTYFGTPALEFSTLLEVTEAVTLYVQASQCTWPHRSYPCCFEGKYPVELQALRSIRVRVTYFGAPALEFPTLLLEQYTYMRAVQCLKGVYPLLWLLRSKMG